MNQRSRRRRLGWLLLALLLVIPAQATNDAPLTLEDVVRMYIGGTDEETLITKIQTSDVNFDLDEEMVDELRIAGIPETVLRAMAERQQELHPVEPPPDEQDETAAARLVVRLNPDWQPTKKLERPLLKMIGAADVRLLQQLGVVTGEPWITDIGIALLCRTSDHVPDQWRSKSPLGRDFNNTPRHKVLVFESGASSQPIEMKLAKRTRLGSSLAERETELPELKELTLAVPEELSVELEPEIAHDLTLGISILLDGRHYLIASASKDGVVIGPNGATTIKAELLGLGKDSMELRVKFLEATEE